MSIQPHTVLMSIQPHTVLMSIQPHTVLMSIQPHNSPNVYSATYSPNVYSATYSPNVYISACLLPGCLDAASPGTGHDAPGRGADAVRDHDALPRPQPDPAPGPARPHTGSAHRPAALRRQHAARVP